jgi:ElaB/YqjD/DUF883 family membrane-anchored ribosome-binding protein
MPPAGPPTLPTESVFTPTKEISMDTTIKPAGPQAPNLADQAADSASSAIRSTQNVANAAFDRLSDQVDRARDTAAPLLDRWSSQAETAARRGADALRDTSAQLREKALRAQDTTVGYIKDEPVKAMLIAAATGAVLMALISLMGRSRPHA